MTPRVDRQLFLQVQARHVRQCWREAKFVAWVWLAAALYCCTTIVTLGYVAPSQRPDEPSLICGIPTWVVWGVLAPWLVLIGVTWLFAAVVLRDDEPYMDFPADDPRDAGEEGNADVAGSD